jgi:putative membrane-bound dehydrogenase-like protein
MSNLRRKGGEGMLTGSAVVAVTACFFLSCTGWSAEPKPESNVVPYVASVPATNALAAFRVRPGFRLELVAREPAVISPVAMAFDENNRLFVVERREDSSAPGTNAHSGRIHLLEDTEGDGEFHLSTVYADNLPWASAVACCSGGVFVATSPDIVFLKDTKTNGIADVRKAIFTSFTGTNLLGARALPNNFNWGMDNRIHAASAGVAAFVPESGAPGAPLVSLTGADFSFDPRALAMCAEAGPAESGLSFDDWGRKFTCDPLRPLRSPRYEPRYLARNPFVPPPPQMIEVASPATPIFRLASAGRPAPARERSRATNELARAVPQVTTVLVATWLTNARGCVVYRGNAFPSNYLGNAFIADPSAHVIHRVVLREAGLDLAAARAPDEKSTEFILSSDPAFRPTQIINGPDGALYVADMRDGLDQGRIYRIVPVDFQRPKRARLDKTTTAGLVATLSHPNGWHRDTAARLLYERRDPAAVPLLANSLSTSRLPLARLHALHALDGLGATTPARLLAGLRDQDERVREHAVRLAENLARGGALPDALWNQIRLTAADPSVRVRYQVALTLGEIHRPETPQVLAGIFLRTPNNPWMQAAILSSLADGAGDLFVTLASDPQVRGDSVGWEFLRRLATMIGVKGRPEEAAQVLGFIDQARLDLPQVFALLNALGDGLHQAGSSLALMDPQNRLQRFYSQASDVVANSLVLDPIRVEAIRLMGVGPYTVSSMGDLLLLPLGSGQSEAIQSAAIATLGRFNDSRVSPTLIQRWRVLTPRLRNDAVTALLARSSRVGDVLTALETGRIDRADLSPAQVNFLRTHRDPATGQRALQLFGPGPRQHPEAVRRFGPALGLKGAAERGRETFVARCAACHQRGGASQGIGPDLVSARIYGKGRILAAILEPNAEVWRDFLPYVIETTEGETLIGLLRGDNAATVSLQPLNGRPVVLPRANIQDLQAQPWSLMPERLEEGLTPQGMADLLEYILRPTATP